MKLALVKEHGRQGCGGSWLGYASRWIWSVLLALAMLPVGCARTQLTRVQDPEYVNAAHRFQRPAVFADAADLAQRKLIEDVVVSELSDRGVAARPSIELLPPTRDYTPEERVEHCSLRASTQSS